MLPRPPKLNLTALLGALNKLSSLHVTEQSQDTEQKQQIELQQSLREQNDILQQLLNTLIDTLKKILSLNEHHPLAREFDNPRIQKMFTSISNYIVKHHKDKTPYEILHHLQKVLPQLNQYTEHCSNQKLILFFTALDQMNLEAPTKKDVCQLCKTLMEIHHTWRRPSLTLESITEVKEEISPTAVVPPLPSLTGLFSSPQHMNVGKVVRKYSSSSASPLISPLATPQLTPLMSPHDSPPLLSPSLTS